MGLVEKRFRVGEIHGYLVVTFCYFLAGYFFAWFYGPGGSFTKAFKSCFPLTPAKLSRICAEQDKKRKKRMEEAAKKNRKVELDGSENR